MSNKYIVANWKSNGSGTLAERYIEKFLNYAGRNKVVICPPYPYLGEISHINNIAIGAQDVSIFNGGPYTGEVSAQILKEFGCQYCIIGHSERRKNFSESEETIKLKLKNLHENGIESILCVGEYEQASDSKTRIKLIENQLRSAIPYLGDNFIIAYEPVWAIGTGKSADQTYIKQAVSDVKSFFKKNTTVSFENNLKILYGGSVSEKNASEILSIQGIDGLLIGGVSLNIEEFFKVANIG